MKKVAVIIVTYKFPQTKVERLINEITKQGIGRKDIFVRDNTNDNIGYAGAINEIVKKQLKNYQYFLILNPDIKLHAHAIQELLKTAGGNKGDIIGGVIYDEKRNVWGAAGVIDKKRYSAGMIQEAKNYTLGKGYGKEGSSSRLRSNNNWIPDKVRDDDEKDSIASLQNDNEEYGKKKWVPDQVGDDIVRNVDFVPGTVMLIRSEVFEKIGYFQTDYFLYYDEVDFQERAKKSGFRLVINPNAKITHFASETVGKNSAAMHYYIARSHMMFVERYAPFPIKLRELIRLPRTLYQARNNKWELLGIRDYFLRKRGRNDRIKVEADK